MAHVREKFTLGAARSIGNFFRFNEPLRKDMQQLGLIVENQFRRL